MTTKQLESLVNGIQKPVLDRGEIGKLLDRDDFDFTPIQEEGRVAVVHTNHLRVAQSKPQEVAQRVAQEVAQISWVAQNEPQKVAQKVAQDNPPRVAQRVMGYQTQADRDVERFKEQICQILTIEGRKRFCLDLGFSIESQRRGGKAYYLYGIKKLEGKKRRLYIGNSARL